MPDIERAVTVTQLTSLIRDALAVSPDLEDILVEGEISNLSTPVSGHFYFTLKDSASAVKCVVFRSNAQRVGFRLENGMTVFVHGRIDVYQQQGQYQLYGDRIEPSGVGAIALAIEQTKKRLSAEGLFDEQLKRPIPPFPRRVVVVTSRTGAAWRDVSTVLRRRAPWVDIVLSPASVQGEAAVDTIVSAINRASMVRGADVILVVRGGGSIEDLAAFSDEKVVRAVRKSSIPVVAGVGHETDLSLTELAADRRAPTPSAAAEVVVPDGVELLHRLETRRSRLRRGLEAGIARRSELVSRARRHLELVSPRRQLAIRHAALAERLAALGAASPKRRIEFEKESVARRRGQLERSVRVGLDRRRGHLESSRRQLEALSPRRVLDRGFSITLDGSGAALKQSGGVVKGDKLRTILASGEVESTVTDTK